MINLANGTGYNDAILLTSSIRSSVTADVHYRYFEMNVTQGVTYNVTTLSSGDLVAYLYDNKQSQIGYSDDDGDGNNPLIRFTASHTGKVYFVVNAYAKGQVIDFEAVLSEVEAVEGDSFDTAIEINIGEAQSISMIPNFNETYFKVNLSKGSVYTIQSFTDYDLRVTVYDSNFNEIADDDDGGENYNFNCEFDAITSLIYFKIYSYDDIDEDNNLITIYLTENDPSKVNGVSIRPDSVNIKIGKTVRLTSHVTPVTAIDKTVTWETSDPSKATVDANGLVTTIDIGRVTITAITNDGGFIGSASITVNYFDGSGTLNDPFLVDDAEQFNKMYRSVVSHYKQTNDIDLSEVDYMPIAFSGGGYDGNGYKIKNVNINKPNESNIGLFTRMYEGYLKNITLENVNIVGKNYVGGLVAQMINPGSDSITNCHVINGSIKGELSVGGLVGEITTNVSYCSANVSVEGVQQVGGLIGTAGGSKITKCFSTSNVYGDDHTAGGFIGYMSSTSGAISAMYTSSVIDCYSTGDVTLNTTGIKGQDGGGFVGSLYFLLENSPLMFENCYTTSSVKFRRGAGFGDSSTYVTYKNCFALNSVLTQFDEVSGFPVYDFVSQTASSKSEAFENCYVVDDMQFVFNKNIYGLQHTKGTLYVSRQQAQKQSTYESIGWDFENVWGFKEGDLYPTLIPYDGRNDGKKTSEGYLHAIPLKMLKFAIRIQG